jgi:hypothetical protein
MPATKVKTIAFAPSALGERKQLTPAGGQASLRRRLTMKPTKPRPASIMA